MKSVTLGADTMTIEGLEAIARGGARVAIDAEALTRVARSRGLVEAWVREGRAVYGVTTGFGALCNVAIPFEQTRVLQKNILLSHALR